MKIMLGSPLPLQLQGWHELPSTSGFPKKPGAHLRQGRGQQPVWPCSSPAPTRSPACPQPLLPGSPLTGGSCVARFAETLGAAAWKDAAHREATKMEGCHAPAHPAGAPAYPGWAAAAARPSRRPVPTQPAYLLEGTDTGQGQLTQGAAGSSVPMRTKPAWQRSQWSPSVLCWQSWAEGQVGADGGGPSSHPNPAVGPAQGADPQVPRGSLHRVPLTMQVPKPGMQRSEWPWH